MHALSKVFFFFFYLLPVFSLFHFHFSFIHSQDEEDTDAKLVQLLVKLLLLLSEFVECDYGLHIPLVYD